MDLTYNLSGTCTVGCSFCPFQRGVPGSAQEHLERITDLVTSRPGSERLFLYGGDVLRRADLPELLEGIVGLRRAPDVYVYTPFPEARELEKLEQIGLKGLTVPLFHPSRRVNAKAPVPADTITAMKAASRTLEVVPYFFLLRQTIRALPTYLREVHSALGNRIGFLRIATLVDDERVDSRYGPIIEPLVQGYRVAEELGIDLSFQADEYPPPCVGDMFQRAEGLYSLVMPHKAPSENTVSPACSECDLKARCRWGYGRYLERYGDAELAPVSLGQLPQRHVREYDQTDAESLRKYRWVLHRQDISVPCSKPWENMEMMGVSEVVSQPCSEDWLKGHPLGVSAEQALEQWNGEFYRKMRHDIATDNQDRVCQPHCMRRRREGLRRDEDDLIEVTGVSDRFLDNRLRHYQELMTGSEVLSSKPLHLAVGPTWACNFSCAFCHSVPLREKTGRPELGREFYDKLVAYLPYVHELSVSGPGEPLVSKQFRGFLDRTDFAEFPDFRITLTTNGSMLAPKVLETLYRVPFKGFIVSLNAGSADVHRAVSGAGHFDKVRRNLAHLIENRHRFAAGPPEVQLSFVLIRKNFRDLPQFLELADHHDRPIIVLAMEIDQYNTAESIIWEPDELAEALEIIDQALERYHRNQVTSQYLTTLRQNLVIQAKDEIVRDIGAA